MRINRRLFLKLAAGGLISLSGCAPKLHAHSAAPSLVDPDVKFRDVTQEAGLLFTQSDGGCGMFYFPEQMAAGAALLDANGDGFLDIYFPAPKPLGPCKITPQLRQRLYLNDGNGGFKLSENAFGGSETDYAIACAIGDYNNDGCPDIYVCCAGRNTLYRNRGDGTFEDVTEQAGVGLRGLSTSAVWFDYDGDGHPDLYVSRYCDWTLETDMKCPGSRGEREYCFPHAYPASTGVLYHNNGDGTFTDVSRQAGIGLEARRGLGVAAADFDGDGRLDLFVANDEDPNFLYQNSGDGTFQDIAFPRGCAVSASGRNQANMGVAVGDYDGDGDLDILVTTFSGEPYTLYRNDGQLFTDVSVKAGVAAPTIPFLGFGTGFFDARNSGLLDLFFANGHVYPNVTTPYSYKQRNQLLLNNGAGGFEETRGSLPENDIRVHRGACFGDFNNDGRIDILVTANNDSPTMLKNESTAGNWLLLRLIDRHGCATPVGARCIATVGGKRFLRVLLGGGSYAGDSDPRVHFGLGTSHNADIEIKWLSCRRQVLKGVAANQILTVREDKDA
ncbi:MAG TPA: CRTAC1 family protein [Capsulimonadaceae bacterium]|nr:CRTAC1 family protein [Capsulimonadaceae bacterium]